jgi:hypothetical protein
MAQQAFPQDVPWSRQAVVFLGTPFDRPRFNAITAERNDLQVAQRRAGLCMSQSAQRVREADPFHRHALPHGGRVCYRTHQVIDQGKQGQFLEDAIDRCAV